ncbi:MAG TPA: hypothetical protein VLA78_11445, partial [Paracoccaceae bacterium]|nr:hypothetical protein [Paracoccaceae bacterium]
IKPKQDYWMACVRDNSIGKIKICDEAKDAGSCRNRVLSTLWVIQIPPMPWAIRPDFDTMRAVSPCRWRQETRRTGAGQRLIRL